MKANILKIICFTVILVFLLKVFSYIFSPKNNGENDGGHYIEASGILAEKENSIDVLILGNSEALTSIIPMEMWNDYGFTSYVCATVEQTIPEEIYLLRRALKKQKPKMLILEADNILMWSKISNFISSEVEYRLPIVKYHNRWKKLSKKDFTKKINYDNVRTMKGYYFVKDIQKAENTNYMVYKNDISNIPRANKIYLKLLSKYCKDNQIQLAIVKTPVTSTWNQGNHDEISDFSNSISVPFLDMNLLQDEIKIDWAHDSKDGGEHLNHFGALKTTKYLGKYLKSFEILPDYRNNKNYQDWTKLYEEYEQIVGKQ